MDYEVEEMNFDEEIIVKSNNPGSLVIDSGAGPIMEITHEGKIKFNHKTYPDMAADEFASAVMKIMEEALPWKNN
tara:strand:+ start:786 stop:1010 length:225 start_codon:yes stop_codon:yes gene_type:complete